MTKMLLMYIYCTDTKQAETIGRALLTDRLIACYNVIDHVAAEYFWPPKTNTLEKTTGVILLGKTLENKWHAIEEKTRALHSDDTPDIMALPISHVSEKYLEWVTGELS